MPTHEYMARLKAALDQMQSAMADESPPYRITLPEPYRQAIKDIRLVENSTTDTGLSWTGVSLFGIQFRISDAMPVGKLLWEYCDGSGAVFDIEPQKEKDLT